MNDERTTLLNKMACHDCGKTLDAATHPRDIKKPVEGDITICIYCGHVMAFDDKLSLRALNDEEAHYVAGNDKILRYQQALASIRKTRDST